MSINVHVTGNPISIKRGKMVTSDLDYTKTEFDKRRLMRLEQVRQQSKDIAEDVRNKVRKEKKKQMREIEKEGKDKLKNWQNRKLLELQTQYENALRDIGAGHRQADEFQNESENMTAQHEINKQISNQRGKEAATKLHLEKTEKVAMKNVPSERKKLIREIENTRSAMVAKFPKSKLRNGEPHKKKKKRTPSADINITISDSDSDPSRSMSPSEVDDTEESQEVECQDLGDSTNESNSTTKSPIVEAEKYLAPDRHQKHLPKSWQIPPLRLSTLHENEGMDSDRQFINEDKISQSVPNHPPQIKSKSPEPPRDTRISDRIRRRGIMASQPEYCSNVAETHPIPFIESNTKIREAIDSRLFGRPCSNSVDQKSDKACFCTRPFSNDLEIDQRLNVSPDPGCICGRNQQTCHPMCGKVLTGNENKTADDRRSSAAKEQQKFTGIPSKPTVKLKSSAGTSNQLSQVNNISSKASVDHSENLIQNYDSRSKPKPTAGHFVHQTQFNEFSSKPSVAHSDNLTQLHDIPSKPSVKLKSSTSHSDSLTQVSKSTDTNKVQFYDHPNRFTHIKKMPTYVEKIPTESLEVIPDVTSEEEWLEKIKQRDKEAQLRGKKALNKEKVRKDYEEMMKKLPLLQKKERISEIYNDKPEYHMSEDRLKERERMKQNNLENAFNKMFPDLKPAIVTLPRKTPSRENIEKSEEEAVRSLNVGTWDVDFEQPKMFTAQEVQEIVRAFTGHETKDRRAKLKELLRSLKLQKEQLLKEIGSLPRDESINELINDLKSFSDSDDKVGTKCRKKERSKSGKKRSRDRKEKDRSADSSQEPSEKDHAQHAQPEQDANKSPRKKAKMRSRRKVLVLQNISTQTTPKVVKGPEGSDTQMTGEVCTKLHTLCDCNKENEKQPPEELCQILIRLNDDENPDIVVKSKEAQLKKVGSKSVGIGTEESPKTTKKPSPVITERGKSAPQTKASGGTKSTWRDQLSKNSISTTSTSYMSPPDLQKIRDSQKSSLYNLRKKPQQQELPSAFSSYHPRNSTLDGSVDPKLVDQVHKLLRMARGSVENLNVSTSSVPTPTQSIIEIESNNPKANIFDTLKAFHLKIGDIAEGLSYSPDYSPVPYNTSASTTASDILKKQDSSSRTASRLVIPEKDSSTSNRSKESVLAQYADITDSCSKRIQTLADMIQRLREEKIQMLQIPPETSRSKSDSPILSDKDFSTAYMDLPDSKESSKNSGNSLDEEEIYKKLMEIDLSLAKKLRQFTFDEKSVGATQRGGANNETEASGSKERTSSFNSTNQEIITRLKQLQQQESTKAQHELPTASNLTEANDQPFVPFLSDIPKLPKFEPQPNSLLTNHKRPPPSKGLTVVRKFNGNISLTPHELSTIVEADSQLSTKMGSNVPSPNASKISMGMSSLKDIELIMIPERKEVPESRSDSTEPERTPQIAVTAQRKTHNQISPRKQQPSPNDSKNSSSTRKDERGTSSEKEYNDIGKVSSNTTASRSINYCDDSSCRRKSLLKTTSSSSDDMETIEAMLKSIGMEWAIPTLHKTQEALALTSSSSSLDLTAKKKNESSGSEISLKEFLRKQMLSRVSSSTMKTDASPGSLIGDFSDLSAIQAANSSLEKERQRTSTPMTSSKSTSKSKVIFSADSDISSVRNETLNHSKRK